MNIKKIKIENMKSLRGNEVANQFVITTDDGEYFQSYKSIIAFKPNRGNTQYGSLALDVNKWDCSKTTGKYRNTFLGESKKETEQKIKQGIYKLVNLN